MDCTELRPKIAKVIIGKRRGHNDTVVLSSADELVGSKFELQSSVKLSETDHKLERTK
jgi:hypothetical protein